MSINFENDEICCVRPRQCLTTPSCGAPGPVDSIYESHLGVYRRHDLPHLRNPSLSCSVPPCGFQGTRKPSTTVAVLSNLEPINPQNLHSSPTGTWQFRRRPKLPSRTHKPASLWIFNLLQIRRKTQKGPKGAPEDHVLLERQAGKYRPPSW